MAGLFSKNTGARLLNVANQLFATATGGSQVDGKDVPVMLLGDANDPDRLVSPLGTDSGLGISTFTVTTPTAPAASAPQSGGTLTVAAHTWQVVGVTDYGDSIPSPTVSATPTGGNQTITLSWLRQSGIIGWKVLRDGLLITAVMLPPGTLSLVDTGAVAGSAYTPITTNPLAAIRFTNTQANPAYVTPAGVFTTQPNAGISVASVTTQTAFPVGTYLHPTAGVAVGGAKELEFYANISAINGATVTFFVQRLALDGTTWVTVWTSPAFTTSSACIASLGAGMPTVAVTPGVHGSAGVNFGETVRCGSIVATATATYNVMCKASK